MDFEDILMDVGDRGKYQKQLIIFFAVPSLILIPFFSMSTIFMLSIPDHWCSVPEVVHSNLTIEQQRQLVSSPSDSKCHMYDINYTDYLSSGIYTVPNDTTTRPCTNGWEHDKTDYESTAATQWKMFCEDEHYTSFVLTLYCVGGIIGTPIYGALADRIGRKITFFICLAVTAASSIASVLMTDFIAFVVIKSINGALMPSIFQIPYIIGWYENQLESTILYKVINILNILDYNNCGFTHKWISILKKVLELVAPEIRTHINGLSNCAWSFGMCLLPLVAYLSRSWVTLGHVASSLTVLCFIYWKYLPESPRWLLSQERYDEALTIMKKIADVNGKSPDPEQLLAKLKTLGGKIKKEKTVDNVKNSPSDLLKYPQVRKTFIIVTICWIADTLSYYGLVINVTNLAGNEFLNFFLTAIVEIPGFVTSWIVMDKLGRRWTTVMWFVVTGLASLSAAVVSELPYADIICSMIAKYSTSAAYMSTYQQSSELYPTVVRSLGMGISSTIAAIASLILPYLIYLSVYGKAIPFVTIGSSCIIAGIAASFLPETMNEPLPQTISDAEEFGKDRKYFSCYRRKRFISRE